ncbi:MAG: MBL fold metallo-hydrolase [Candidatus Woesearchaeota archaeon]|nr:MAG: MBL fold metallo-hydrolase [Candidatus Woesearchaeota archaeon]
MVKIIPLGGYGEIGRNCTYIEEGSDGLLLDLGLHVDRFSKNALPEMSLKALRSIGAIPNITDVKKKVKALFISHAHLDHLGALQFYKHLPFPVYGTPFSLAVIRQYNKKLNLKPVSFERNIKVGNIQVKFIHVTHSTIQSALILVKTKTARILYANDFRLDDAPTLGEPPDYEGIVAAKPDILILNSLNNEVMTTNPTEQSVARDMCSLLRKITKQKGLVVVTTFASHISRIKTIIDCAKRSGRTITLLGNSLHKYVKAAEEIGIDFEDVRVLKRPKKIENFLASLVDPSQHVLLVTGHQAEPSAVLSRMVRKGLYNFKKGDEVIFSCRVIPTPENEENRRALEALLEERNTNVTKEIHTSGHATRPDREKLLTLAQPKLVLPTHGTPELNNSVKLLAEQHGAQARILENGDVFVWP